MSQLEQGQADPAEQKCRFCGCTETHGCVHVEYGMACTWLYEDVCSACTMKAAAAARDELERRWWMDVDSDVRAILRMSQSPREMDRVIGVQMLVDGMQRTLLAMLEYTSFRDTGRLPERAVEEQGEGGGVIIKG